MMVVSCSQVLTRECLTRLTSHPLTNNRFCFLFDTYPNGQTYNKTSVCNSLCNQTYYDGLSACLNCIVANGGESTTTIIRPSTSITSRSTSSAISASTSSGRSTAQGYDFGNPNGAIDLNQANGWLKNITDYCSPRGVTFTGRGSVTAIPTTT